ncbi:hypothetical protein M422DRAFT_28063 [Sphaerobolus stellatus SS14]|nr:hypothetical protein M422DRAFT_28063 [Sphaerobolus stellatus SS14]
MQSLISGAECATVSNPLSQVLKHTEGDRSLQRDRVDGPSSSRLHHLPHSATGPTNAADLAMARQFFQSGPLQAGIPAFNGLPASSRHMLENLQHIPNPVHTHNAGPTLAARPLHTPSATGNWSEEFKQVPQGLTSLSSPQIHDAQLGVHYPMSDLGSMRPMYQSFQNGPMPVNWDQEFSRVDTKGKGKATEADFEAAFARAAASISAEKSRIVEVQEDESLEEAFNRVKVSDEKERVGDSDKDEYLSDFEKVWQQLKNSELPPPEEDVAKWEAEFNQLMQSERETDYDEDMENLWKNGLGNYGEDFQGPEPIKFDDDGIPDLDPYKFESSNPYLAEPSGHLARAKQLLEENGSLTEAALLLEAAIQKGDLGEGGYEAWILLGDTRSMDEREEAGMRALREGVQRAQQVGNHQVGMISLAISYTNEAFDRASHTTLLKWLSAKYPDLIPTNLKGRLPTAPWASHDQATETFIAVARQQHARGEMDPDVQIGLGVLFYTNSEFDKAKDCFESALASRPNDYLLWNRLGSCLSNGSKPEEALAVYREALQRRPTYTRAIYNVGVACLNIGAYKEAAEHFLSALAMQESSGGDKSEQLWTTLRKCFAAMDRLDLAEAAKVGQALETFRQEGFEF